MADFLRKYETKVCICERGRVSGEKVQNTLLLLTTYSIHTVVAWPVMIRPMLCVVPSPKALPLTWLHKAPAGSVFTHSSAETSQFCNLSR
jgi:hypothetical protein